KDGEHHFSCRFDPRPHTATTIAAGFLLARSGERQWVCELEFSGCVFGERQDLSDLQANERCEHGEQIERKVAEVYAAQRFRTLPLARASDRGQPRLHLAYPKA